MRGIHMAAAAVLLAGALTGCAASTGTSSGASGASAGSVTDASSPVQIVSSVCTRCHNTDRIKAAQHDATAWKATIDRMRGKGAAIDDAQEAKVVEFLAGGGAASL